MTWFDLRQKAVDFGGEISDLLNATVCDGVRLSAALQPNGAFLVSYKLSERDQNLGKAIPVTLGRKAASCYLGLSFRLVPDAEQSYLMVESSVIALYEDEDEAVELLHYDYERDKPHGYPEAHLQIEASSDAWAQMCRRAGRADRPLKRLHLPVGGRRYRPTVEDVVEFLVVEGLAEGRRGWKEAVESGRTAFQRRQTRAAVRRDPVAAQAVLRELGHL